MDIITLIITSNNMILYEGSKDEALKVKENLDIETLGLGNLELITVNKRDYDDCKGDIVKLDQFINSNR